MKKIVFEKERVEKIIEDYTLNHKSLDRIGKEYGVSRSVITRILKESKVNTSERTTKYYCNKEYFKEIDTIEKAYWLGFIAADGCVYKRKEDTSGNFMYINLSRKDKNHIEKFKKAIESNATIKDFTQTQGFSNESEMSKIVINCSSMVEDLIDKGIVPNKSLILKPPKIKEKFCLPFILGYFDGDGSIYKTNDIYGINIVGTKEMLEWINSILNISNQLEKRKNDNKNNYYIRCGGTNKPYLILKKNIRFLFNYIFRKKKSNL